MSKFYSPAAELARVPKKAVTELISYLTAWNDVIH